MKGEEVAKQRRGGVARWTKSMRLQSFGGLRRWSMYAIVVVLAAGGGACERHQSTSSGHSQVPQAARRDDRIAVLSPAAAVILRDLGAERLIAARHAFDAATKRDVVVVGDQAGIDYEALIAVSPTHVVMQWGARELPVRLTELAKASGWKVIDVNPVSIADVRATVKQLADFVLGDETVKRRAVELDAQLAEIEAASVRHAAHDASSDARKRVVLLLSTSPFAALGPTSCQAEAVRAGGFVVEPQDAKAYVELSSEELLRLDPDAFIVFSPSADGAMSLEDEAALRERLVLPLRKLGLGDKPVLLMTDVESLLPSTSMVRLRKKVEEWGAGSGGR